MKLLIADDDPVSRLLLKNILCEWQYEVVSTNNGLEAWKVLMQPAAPRMAILDWQMPGSDGPELCRRARAEPATQSTYILLLTGKQGTGNVVQGLRSGANDYLTKPFDLDELAARLAVGRRVVELQSRLAERVSELEQALAQVKRLQRLIPICAWCRKVRNDSNFWQQVEEYIGENSDVRFSHGICPQCFAANAAEADAGAEADRQKPH